MRRAEPAEDWPQAAAPLATPPRCDSDAPVMSPEVWPAGIESVADATLVADRQGVIQFANAAAEGITGKKRSELIGTAFGVPVTGAQRTEIELATPHESPRPCEMVVTKTTVADADAFVLALRDISQRRRIAQDEQRARQEAEAAARATRALIDMVAHELKAPLAVIRGYLELICSGELGELPAACIEPFENVVAKADELKAMVERILTAARLEAGKLSQGREVVDLRQVVRAALDRADATAAIQSAELKMRLPAGPVMAEVDPTQVAIVLDNLINNALKYSEEDPRVEVRLEAAVDRAEIRVLDNGIGIADDQLDEGGVRAVPETAERHGRRASWDWTRTRDRTRPCRAQ